MTIVHVIPFLWSGAGRVVIRLCEAQRRDGHAVHVVTSVKSRGLSDWTWKPGETLTSTRALTVEPGRTASVTGTAVASACVRRRI